MNDKTSPEREDGYWVYKVQMTSGGWVWFPLSSTQLVCAGGRIELHEREENRWPDGKVKGIVEAGKWDYWFITWQKREKKEKEKK